MNIVEKVFIPSLYEKALCDIMAQQQKFKLPKLDGLSCQYISANRDSFIQSLIKTIKSGEYCNVDNPYLSQHAWINTKLFIEYSLTDLLLQKVIASLIHDELCTQYKLENYCLKLQQTLTVKEKIEFVQAVANCYILQKQVPDNPIYVSQFDLELVKEDYSLTEKSFIWQKISSLYTKYDKNNVENIFNYVFRPLIIDQDGNIASLITLDKLSECLTDVCIHCDLHELDGILIKHDQIFYARTNKTIIIIAKDKNVAIEVNDVINLFLLRAERLMKIQRLQFTCLSDIIQPQIVSNQRHASSIKFLGLLIFCDGSIGLQSFHLLNIFNEIRHKLQVTAQLLPDSHIEQRITLLSNFCSAYLVQQINQPLNESFQLLAIVTNNKQREYICIQLVSLIKEAVTIATHDILDTRFDELCQIDAIRTIFNSSSK